MVKKYTPSEATVALHQVQYGASVIESIDVHTLIKAKIIDADTGKGIPTSAVVEGIAKNLNDLAFRLRLHERAMRTND